MKLLDLFKTIVWAKNGDTTDFSQTNYEAGWAHLGDDTPTVQDFNYVQQMNDKKDQWLFKQLKAVMENAGIEPTEDNINALLNAILKIAKGHSTPKAINAETMDFVDETGHTHSISKASLTQLGIVQLTNSLDSDSETLGLTAKAGKALKALINALTSNLQNYIPNSKKSNSVTSTSSDTVATSYAAKTAYDKAKAADDNANTRVSKSGGEMTGGLKLKANFGTPEKKWDYSGFYAGSATLNNEALPYFQIHIGSYGGNTAGYAKSLGFNLTDYKAYVMNWNSEGEYAGKKEILTELHRSDSVTSTSSDTVATSKAVKTAYDKAVDGVNKADAAQTAANDANNNAESRLLKSGGLINGNLSVGGRLTASNIIEIKEGSEKQNLTNLFGSNVVWGIAGGDKNTLGLTQDMYDWGVGLSLNQSGTKALLYIPHRTNTQTPDLWIKTHYNDSRYTPSNWTKVMMVDYLVGMPLPWMQSTVPAGFLAMQGQAFDKVRYPILAQRYPSGRLPDLRGEFIRGWDNGRGADSGRTLLSSQDDAFQDHYHALPTSNGNDIKTDAGISHVILDNNTSTMPLGSFYDVNNTRYAKGNNAGINSANITRTYSVLPNLFRPGQSDKGLLVPKATPKETRPRNIAYQYICLAA
ncbi:tail fiber protein [Gallibacterium anatis]|uniref:tail fiber protein n=1 Tax=Gallibacterium anatis TaxID=750 RepID=UPI00068BB7CB|nr:tail fiber protein [Gallibacterium anatis]